MSEDSRRRVPPHKKAREIVGANLTRLMAKSVDMQTSRQVEARSRDGHPDYGIGRKQVERIMKGEIATTLDTLGYLADLFEIALWELLVDRRADKQELLRGNMSRHEKNVKYSPDSTMQTGRRRNKLKSNF